MKISRRHFLTSTGGIAVALCVPATALTAKDEGNLGERQQIRALLDRLSFGPRPGDVTRVTAMGLDAYIDQQLHPDSIEDGACAGRTRRLETLQSPVGELFEYKEALLWKELATAKLLRACYSERQLFEVMVDFWSDHFNIDSSKGDCPWLKTADDRDVIRKHALGRFSELLRASALGPAMLWYLDGRVNRRRAPEEAPNENYARELLELHTVGVHGGYQQADVMEIARCLTGWTVRTDTWFGKGRVEFDSALHDDGPKRVLGTVIPAGQGEGDVDAVLRILTNSPETARHLATKLCHRFVGETLSASLVDTVAASFMQTDGDIAATLRTLLFSEAFRRPEQLKFKRPFRFLVSALRATAASIDSPEALLDYLARMGHSPFQFPTPDGYPEEANPWMGSMLWRWHFVHALAHDSVAGVSTPWTRLREEAGGGVALAASLLGRPLTESETRLVGGGVHPGLIMAAPRYQGA